jgi:polyhydroxybutyrate depolymerase
VEAAQSDSLPARGRAALTLVLRLIAFLLLAGVGLVATGLATIYVPTLWRQATGHITVETMTQGSLTREFRVYRPSARAQQVGLVIVLHGADASGLQIERQAGFDAQAERLGWIAAYPDGVADGWEPFGCCHHDGVDDVAFIGGIVDRLTTSDAVDPNRVYVTGISRGGMMAYRLACEMSSRLAAIAPVAGNMADSTGNVQNVSCRPDRPVSILAVHGADDPEIPIDGGRSRVAPEEVAYAPLAAVIATWRGLDACATTTTVTRDGPATETRWSCDRGTHVEVLVISGAGHAWPGAPIVQPPWGPGASVDASRTIADFFLAHVRVPSRA